MSNLIDQITIGSIEISVLDADPAQTGFQAELGSIAIVPSINKLFHKIGIQNTDWDLIVTKSQLPELAQDAVAQAFASSPDIQLVYNDGADSISAQLTSTGVTAGSFGASNKAVALNIDSKGRIASAAESLISMPAAQISDFNSAVESVVGFSKASIQTSDATETVLWQKVVPANKAFLVKAFVIGMDSSNQAAVFERSAAVRNSNGTVSKVGQTQSAFTEKTSGTEASNVHVDVVGSLVQVKVIGLPSAQMNWSATVQVVSL